MDTNAARLVPRETMAVTGWAEGMGRAAPGRARRSVSKKTKTAGKRPAPKRKATPRPARKAAPAANKRVAELEAENRRLRAEVDRLRAELGDRPSGVGGMPPDEVPPPEY